MALPLKLFGEFQVGRNPPLSLRRKNRAILAYLFLAERPIPRQDLAYLFCQSAADPAHTLRLSLSRLRRTLGQEALVNQGDNVEINRNFFKADLTQFQKLLDKQPLSDLPLKSLAEAVNLYKGEFVAGLHLPDAAEFEMWLLGQRSHWRQVYERGALVLLKRQTAGSQYQSALQTAQQLVRHNHLLEEAHYHLIWLYARTGQRTAAVEQFNQCRTILREELAVEPTPELQALYQDILAGRLARPKLSVSPPVEVSAVPAPDFVGREYESQRLDEIWNGMARLNQRIVLISAEAGGGKTRLVQEWAKRLPGDVLVYGACYESTQNLAYHPWLALLEEVYNRIETANIKTHISPSHLVELARLIPALAEQHLPSGEGHQAQLFAAVHLLLDLLEQPLVLFLDDLQWADAASLALLHILVVHRLTPVLFIGAYRSEEAEDNEALQAFLRDLRGNENVIRLELAPLTAESVAQLMRLLWPQLPEGFREPHLRDRLVEATGGNPLFVNEIIRELAGSTHLPHELPVPPSLRDLIHRRLRELPSSGRQVLESLAVLDQPAEFDLAREISGRSEEETLVALEFGLQRRLLVSSEEAPPLVDFRHDLMGQAVRAGLSPIRRQILHRRTAVTLAAQGVKAAILAYHWGRAGDRQQERRFTIQAGHDSAGLYAYHEAIGYWQRALELTAEPVEQAHLYHQLGRAFFQIGEWDESEAMFKAGLALVGQEHSRVTAELQAGYGLLLEYRGDYAQAQALEEAALAYFQAVGDHPQIARTKGLIALLHWRQARYEEALALCQEGLADPDAVMDPTTHTRLLNISGLIYWRRQEYERAYEFLQRAYQTSVRFGDQKYMAIVTGNMGNVVQEMGQYQRAIKLYHSALELYQEMKNQMGVAVMLGNIGLMYFYLGDDETAVDYGQMAMAMDREMGNQESVARHLSNLANSYNRMERYQDAFDNCREALEIDAGLGNRRGALIHAGNLSTIYLLWGHTAEALACLIYALHLDDRLEHTRELARHLTGIAAVHLFENDLAKAEAILQLALPWQEKLAIDFELAWAFLVKGRVALRQEQYSAAVTSFEQAQDAAQKSNRDDIEFEAAVRLPRAQWLSGEVDAETAVQRLAQMLENSPTLQQEAAIYYEQWRIGKGETDRRKAQQAYQKLLRQSYTAEARRRAEALEVENLPPLPIPPPLPQMIAAAPLDHESILEKIAV